MMFWRFLPLFVTDPKEFKLSTINAKAETLMSNKMWQDSFIKRRCLVPWIRSSSGARWQTATAVCLRDEG